MVSLSETSYDTKLLVRYTSLNNIITKSKVSTDVVAVGVKQKQQKKRDVKVKGRL